MALLCPLETEASEHSGGHGADQLDAAWEDSARAGVSVLNH